MAITSAPYLNFDSTTREAMEFYQSVFGGELVVLTFADMGMTDMPADGVMHAALRNGPVTLHASDAQPGAAEQWGGTRVYLSVTGDHDDLDTISGWFDRLAEGGEVGVPLSPQGWGTFGLVRDRFGLEWMLNAAAAQ